MELEKNIKLKVTAETGSAKQQFDGLEVGTKELQERISYLAAEMRKMETQFGKSGMASEKYAMLQRESRLATEQLINTEEEQVAVAQKGSRGLGSLSSAALSAMGSISGLGTGVSTLTSALMSGAGLTAGLAVAVVGFSLFMEIMRDTSKEAEKLKKAIEEIINVKAPKGAFNVDPEKLSQAIKLLQDRVKMLSAENTPENPLGQMPGYQGKIWGSGDREALKDAIELLKEENEQYKIRKKLIDTFTKGGLTYTLEPDKDAIKEIVGDVKKINKGFEGQSDIIKTLDAQLEKIQNKYKAFFESQRQIKDGTFFKGKLEMKNIKQPDKPGLGFSDAEIQRDFLKENSFLINQVRGDLSILQGEFSTFWQNAFGEANSLLEKFLMNFAEGLLELAAQSLIGGILNFLLPGSGGIAGMAMGGGSNGPTSIINLNMDNRTVAQFYVNGKNQAGRLRMG